MKRMLAMMLTVLGTAVALMAQAQEDGSAQVPEINGSTAATAIALVSGAILLVRGRRSK
jgi:hypothetical protein